MYKFLESALIRKFGKQWYYNLVDKAKKEGKKHGYKNGKGS